MIHIHCHCSHSLLDGLGNPQTWVDAAVKKGFPALAITDHGSCAALDFTTSKEKDHTKKKGSHPL